MALVKNLNKGQIVLSVGQGRGSVQNFVVWLSFLSFKLFMVYNPEYDGERERVCVCEREREREREREMKSIVNNIRCVDAFMYVYVRECVCACTNIHGMGWGERRKLWEQT